MKSLIMKLWCGISGKDYSAWKAEQMRKQAEEDYQLKKLAKKIEEEIKLKDEIDLLEKESANIQKCFHELKSSSVFVDEQTLEEYKANIAKLAENYEKLGQYVAAAKHRWLVELVGKEKQLLELGINQCLYKSDLADIAEKHPSRAIKFCSLVDYPRVIPSDVAERISKVQGIFDDIVIMYTDHTRKAKTNTVRKRTDPIAFGMFTAKLTVTSPTSSEVSNDISVGGISVGTSASSTNTVRANHERMYFIGDWEDEFCDLTLERLAVESEAMNKVLRRININTPVKISQRVAELS